MNSAEMGAPELRGLSCGGTLGFAVIVAPPSAVIVVPKMVINSHNERKRHNVHLLSEFLKRNDFGVRILLKRNEKDQNTSHHDMLNDVSKKSDVNGH